MNPNFVWSAFSGAEAPNVLMPITSPSGPTYAAQPNVEVYHAGTALQDGRVVTAGGRVLAVSALGHDLADARDRAYAAASLISFEGMHYRRDVALKAAIGD